MGEPYFSCGQKIAIDVEIEDGECGYQRSIAYITPVAKSTVLVIGFLILNT